MYVFPSPPSGPHPHQVGGQYSYLVTALAVPPDAVVLSVQPVRSPVSKFPLFSEEAARAGLPLAATTSAIVAKAAAIAANNVVERIPSLCMSLRPMGHLPSVGGGARGVRPYSRRPGL